MPESLIKERSGGKGGKWGTYSSEEKKRRKKKSSLEVELVLQSLLSLCTEWNGAGGVGGGFGQNPRV